MKHNLAIIISFVSLAFVQSGCLPRQVKHQPGTICTNTHILGKWVDNRSIERLRTTFHFLENGQFIQTKFAPKKEEKRTFHGEYVVVESGVFIRYFGSMHWPSEGDNEDIHTSIDSKYLYLREPGRLVEVNEDYEFSWEKQ